ncbi:unnamed protein product [Rotaria sp. Silwood2]|nr:unnamed protein product [Rotaria sp. Silwood2]CAF2959259.1 unnamed protein product [Rotaria sp. Silwood2]CAF3007504.1 unnamed protein product [Rotaria sp. Silwood2]CAF3398259.1 unnamed protein product [Rotaria sp. Silwood2]CAF4215507.1 unnamed protein product [Rotaria sp. Silwood2]
MPRQSKKISKDPNAPKRPLSGYFLFARDERPKIKLTQPNVAITGKKNREVMKVIGQRWSNLDVDLKKQYVKLAAEEKIRYDQEMAVYRRKTAITNSIVSMDNQVSVIE